MKSVLFAGLQLCCLCFLIGCQPEEKTEGQASGQALGDTAESKQESATESREKFTLVSMMKLFCGLDDTEARNLRRFYSDRAYQLEHIAFPLEFRRTENAFSPQDMARDPSQFLWHAHNWEFLTDQPFDTSDLKFECSRSDTGFSFLFGVPNSDVFGEARFKLNAAREPVLVYYSSTFKAEDFSGSKAK